MEQVSRRFMFDTNAINKICNNPIDEIDIFQSKERGFEYYFSEIQCLESAGTITKVSMGIEPFLVERNRAEYALNLLRVIPKLQSRYVMRICTFHNGKFSLDGSESILPAAEYRAAEMYKEILSDNSNRYYNDGMIALTAIVHGCTLVTNDKRLFTKVNRHFTGRAIKYEDFMNIVRRSVL